MASCESDFIVRGLQRGEKYFTPVRIAATLIAFTVTSSWFDLRKIKRLSLFFAHWLSGLVLCLGFFIDDMMVTVCWANSNVEGFIKFNKFVEISASNMLAITNLAICVNLTLIVVSHRTMSRVKSVNSPRLLLLFLAISMALAAITVPFWDTIIVLGTGFWITSSDEAKGEFISVSFFYVEFFVGVCMFSIVAWLLAYRVEEVKECWKLHRRIRYYLCLTALGTFVNLFLGVAGTINTLLHNINTALLRWSWVFRYMHIALDTLVLYGVLRERSIDERGDNDRSDSGALSSGRSGPPVSRRGTARESGWRARNTSKPVTASNPPLT